MAEARDAVRSPYEELLKAWNNKDAKAMAGCFATQATMIGFDGSVAEGRMDIEKHLTPIFADHPTAAFVSIVRSERIAGDFAVLRADAGMVPPGKSDINPRTNTRHVVVARPVAGDWRIEVFQNTPTALDQDENSRDKITDDLRAAYKKGGVLHG